MSAIARNFIDTGVNEVDLSPYPLSNPSPEVTVLYSSQIQERPGFRVLRQPLKGPSQSYIDQSQQVPNCPILGDVCTLYDQTPRDALFLRFIKRKLPRLAAYQPLTTVGRRQCESGTQQRIQSQRRIKTMLIAEA